MQRPPGSTGSSDSGTASSPQGKDSSVQVPAITLPKGGGAIRGMGEKFAANPVTGTGSMTVPIATSPGRSGFGPQLSLSYDSGAGNGPFGLGWNLSLPAITRKTDKGLPQYRDAEESDVFLISGAEDLVPVFRQDANANWIQNLQGDFLIHEDSRTVASVPYLVRRYRPRIEGLFSRIERWTNTTDQTDVSWRSISKDNITTWYGKTPESRVTAPSDATRIFSWLICESSEDKGNVIAYRYKSEDSSGVDRAQANEANRDDTTRQAQRYLKRICYGNSSPYLPELKSGSAWPAHPGDGEWCFEVVLDYGEHDNDAPQPNDSNLWPVRSDPFSSYRAGFEVRTYRLCRRALMFHHFPGGAGYDGLVRATEFAYAESPLASLMSGATQSGFKRLPNGSYLKKSLPPLEFSYSEAKIETEIREVDPDSLENLPMGLDGSRYQWVDLDGEGLSGILTEQAEGWFYKRNLSPTNFLPDGERVRARFAPLELVASKPASGLNGGRAQFLDLAGDGQIDLVTLGGPAPGFYERTHDQGWDPFTTFASLPVLDWGDPNLKFVDLTGDGRADILITEDDVFSWHPSLAEEGFGPRESTRQSHDEEQGPRLIFADGTQSIYLADMSGDGLTDLVRVRNGEVCYWANLGYGRFGAKVTMDNSPCFDHPDQFDQKRIRLADIDGFGTTDIIYLHGDGARIYFNESGNSWSQPPTLPSFPPIDNQTSVMVVDLLGNGTACLVWSSALPGDALRPMRYIDLMGGQKPHLLVKTVNNLGAETQVHYAPSTKFYLQDQYAGNPWITKLAFPVHVVERVETYDHISRNRFATRYAYHHGYFDGEEREFRGFGMVEQWDTEALASLTDSGTLPATTNVDSISHVPPVLTRTWFHTGMSLGRDHVSDFFAGLGEGDGEYYREPALRGDAHDLDARALLLPDTVLPPGLSLEEEREACRALKGSMLRQEVYALDGSNKEPHPYTVAEQSFAIRTLQPKEGNRHAVFFTHAREAITYHYERNPADPRVQHALTLEVDDFGNVLRSVAIDYRRRDLPAVDAVEQKQTHLLLTVNRVANQIVGEDWYRIGVPVETRTCEIVKPPEPTISDTRIDLFSFDSINGLVAGLFALGQLEPNATKTWPYEKWNWRQDSANAPPDPRLRLVEHIRTLYRPDDLGGTAQNDPLALLSLGTVESLALPGESYKLAFTPGLAQKIYVASAKLTAAELDTILADEGRYVHSAGDANWWIPSGRMFFSPGNAVTPTQELVYARQHFFLPHRYRDPFHTDTVPTESFVSYDAYDLLMVETSDAMGNRVTVEAIDYRVLQPQLVSDPNRNKTVVTFDTLGLVAGTAVMGKPLPAAVEGDSLDGFTADLTQAGLDAFHDAADPHTSAPALLQSATTRIIYDLDRFQRTQRANPLDATQWLAPYAATLARETHVSDLPQGTPSKIQISFSYSDGFGREIQKKIQAEPGPLVVGGLVVSPRWVGSGWTIFNNKGKPVRQYEPFFTGTHRFEFGVQAGVSPILFYDPVERVVATLHPNHTYEKVVFDPWQQTTHDVNDTVLGDPRTDTEIKGYVAEYFETQPNTWLTWHAQRIILAANDPERIAAEKAAVHRQTPAVAHLDTLGRTFLTIAHNRFSRNNAFVEKKDPTRVELDIEGNQRSVTDALERIVMRYDYSIAGPEKEKEKEAANRVHQSSMEAGERWMLNDVTGKPIRAWDSRGHEFRSVYDQLRRPIESYMRQGAGPELMVGRTLYGETRPNPEAGNLRGKVVQQFDQAGVVTTDAYDFKGNLLRSQRQLAVEYKAALNWSQNPQPALETEIFASSTRYDALNRPIQMIAPHSNQSNTKINVIRPGYNEANLLERVDAWLGQTAEPSALLDPPSANLHPATNIDYDAKGQRTMIAYGNGVETQYTYDPETFRLTSLTSTRPTTFPANERVVQDLSYTYDPAGNITHIQDEADIQNVVFFRNQRVEPSADYTYDALYRLIEATGREHIGQLAQPQTTWDDGFRVNLPHPGDGQAMRSYTEQYLYDAVGNFEQLIHQAAANGSWTRAYAYNEASLIETGKKSNRLSSTTVGATTEPYTYDAHGNMTSMPHLTLMQWDFKGQLSATSRQAVNATPPPGKVPEMTFYVYDGAGQRVRKVTERQNGSRKEERIYLGGFEIYHELTSDGIDIALERETLHIMDDKQRIAPVETRTKGNDPSPQQLIRYQFGNHVGSASLELDNQAEVISYEEYYPFGTTAYQANNSAINAAAKRYRYTGMERDEETGFEYHSARYYLPWLGRWISADPIGIRDGANMYKYAAANPISCRDGTGTQSEPGPTFHSQLPTKEQFKYQLLHLPLSPKLDLHVQSDRGHGIGTGQRQTHRKTSLSLSHTRTTTPKLFASNQPDATFHNTSAWRNYPSFLGLPINVTLPLAFDEPSSMWAALFRQRNAKHTITLHFGALLHHLKPDNLPSGMYLKGGYSQLGPLVGVQFKPKGPSQLAFGVTFSAGWMLSNPTFGNEDATKPPNTFTSFKRVNPFEAKPGYQHVGWGATLTANVNIPLTKRLSVTVAASVHGDVSRQLKYTTHDIRGVFLGEHFDQYQSLSGSLSIGLVRTLWPDR